MAFDPVFCQQMIEKYQSELLAHNGKTAAGHGQRNFTRTSPTDIRNELAYWQQELEKAQHSAAGKPRIGLVGVVPKDR